MIPLPHLPPQPPLPLLHPHRILQPIERVLQNIIAVQLINSSQNSIHLLLRLHRIGEDQEFCASQGFETLEAEVFGFKDFDSTRVPGTVAGCGGGWGERV